MFQKLVPLLACIALVRGVPGGQSVQQRSQDDLGNYQFGYEIVDELGAARGRQEKGDVYGNKIGSYQLADIDGRLRRVDYVADDYGFRATINTNEPGTVPSDVAAASYIGGGPVPVPHAPVGLAAPLLASATKAYAPPVALAAPVALPPPVAPVAFAAKGYAAAPVAFAAKGYAAAPIAPVGFAGKGYGGYGYGGLAVPAAVGFAGKGYAGGLGYGVGGYGVGGYGLGGYGGYAGGLGYGVGGYGVGGYGLGGYGGYAGYAGHGGAVPFAAGYGVSKSYFSSSIAHPVPFAAHGPAAFAAPIGAYGAPIVQKHVAF